MLIKSKEMVYKEIKGYEEEQEEAHVLACEPSKLSLKETLNRYFMDRNGFDIFIQRVESSYEHDKRVIGEVQGKVCGGKREVMNFVCWSFFGVKVLIYFLQWISEPLNMFSSGKWSKSCNYYSMLNLYKPYKLPKNINTDDSKFISVKGFQGSFYGNTYLNSSDVYANQRNSIREAASLLRQAIYKGSNTLTCVLINTKFRDVSSDELFEAQALDEFAEPYMTQQITFGDNINKALKVMFGDRLKMITRKEKTYLLIHNGNIPTLADEIGYMFNEPVKIKVVGNG